MEGSQVRQLRSRMICKPQTKQFLLKALPMRKSFEHFLNSVAHDAQGAAQRQRVPEERLRAIVQQICRQRQGSWKVILADWKLPNAALQGSDRKPRVSSLNGPEHKHAHTRRFHSSTLTAKGRAAATQTRSLKRHQTPPPCISDHQAAPSTRLWRRVSRKMTAEIAGLHRQASQELCAAGQSSS